MQLITVIRLDCSDFLAAESWDNVIRPHRSIIRSRSQRLGWEVFAFVTLEELMDGGG